MYVYKPVFRGYVIPNSEKRVSFLTTITTWSKKCPRGFNALSRAHFISTEQLCSKSIYQQCFNALSRAHFISTRRSQMRLNQMKRFNALSRAHFISTNENEAYNKTRKMFQCPKPGSLHFYGRDYISGIIVRRGFNALSRAHFISTNLQKMIWKAQNMFQCPKSGSLHFYPTLSNPR